MRKVYVLYDLWRSSPVVLLLQMLVCANAAAVAIAMAAVGAAAGPVSPLAKSDAARLGGEPVQYTIAHTKLGDIRGAVRRYGNLTVSEFLGIRYAQAPVGSLRFSKPLPVAPWSPQTYDALALGSWCPQPVSESEGEKARERARTRALPGGGELTSEDCLSLNVYAPYDGHAAAAAAETPRAVMVFVHGGGFKIGSSAQFIGSGLAALGDVVVVTVNYRLGALGFLSTGGSDSPGNYGLWDQRAALAWVRDNADAFGGDPARVTVFGQSAGAASVSYQAATPQNDDPQQSAPFRRVIVESGSLHSPWAFQYAPQDSASELGRRLGCPTSPTAYLVECLRSKSAEDVVSHAGGVGWGPCVDGEFVVDSPDVLAQKVLNGSGDPYLRQFASFDYLVGFNSQEALMFVDKPWTTPSINDVSKNLTGKDISDGLTDEVYSYAIKLIGEFFYNDASSAALFVEYIKLLYETVYRQQLDTIPPGARDMLRLFVQVASDFELVAPTIQTVKLHAMLNGTGKSFHYLYDVKRSFDEPKNIFWEGPSWLRIGADHSDELSSVFAYPYLQGFLPNGSFVHNFNYTEAERELSSAIIRYWTNFAKNGDPNIGYPILKPWDAWSTYDTLTKHYLHIKINESTLYFDAKSQEDFFWNTVVATSRNRFNSSVITHGSNPALTFSHEGERSDFLVCIVLGVLAVCFVAIIVNQVVLWQKVRKMKDVDQGKTLIKSYF